MNGGVSWSVSPFSGSAMIRPIFSTEMDVSLGLFESQTKPLDITLFPNPASEVVYIRSSLGFLSSEKLLLDAAGRELMRTTQESFNLSQLGSGIYFISVPSFSDRRYKVIKL